jgi:hypothetical protein
MTATFAVVVISLFGSTSVLLRVVMGIFSVGGSSLIYIGVEAIGDIRGVRPGSSANCSIVR